MESWELPISYKQIKFSGARDLNILDTRSSPIPQKIRNFLWLFHQDKIQPVDQLIEKEWKGSEWCKLCGVAASADHIMFTCPIAWYVWWMISDMLQWQSCPMHLSDFTIKFSDQGGRKKNPNDLDGLCFLDTSAHQKWAGVPKQSYFLSKHLCSQGLIVYAVMEGFTEAWRPMQNRSLMEKIRKKREETMGGSQIMAGVVTLSDYNSS